MKSATNPIFIVYRAHNRIYALLLSPAGEKKRLIFSETTENTLEREALSSWANWISLDMPGCLSKESMEIDFEKNLLIYRDTSAPFLSFFLQLLSSSFSTIEPCDRRKIGPEPKLGERDQRKIWNPSPIFEGKTFSFIPSEAYTISFKNGPQEIRGKSCIMYFEKRSEHTVEPFQVFPNWIESKGRLFLVVRPIESGILLSTL